MLRTTTSGVSGPNQNNIYTRTWLYFQHPQLITPVEFAIMNNMEVLRDTLRNLQASVEQIVVHLERQSYSKIQSSKCSGKHTEDRKTLRNDHKLSWGDRRNIFTLSDHLAGVPSIYFMLTHFLRKSSKNFHGNAHCQWFYVASRSLHPFHQLIDTLLTPGASTAISRGW